MDRRRKRSLEGPARLTRWCFRSGQCWPCVQVSHCEQVADVCRLRIFPDAVSRSFDCLSLGPSLLTSRSGPNLLCAGVCRGDFPAQRPRGGSRAPIAEQHTLLCSVCRAFKDHRKTPNMRPARLKRRADRIRVWSQTTLGPASTSAGRTHTPT